MVQVGAALSMVYISGAPVMFVGCGQSYTDLKKLNVKSIVRTLLKWECVLVSSFIAVLFVWQLWTCMLLLNLCVIPYDPMNLEVNQSLVAAIYVVVIWFVHCESPLCVCAHVSELYILEIGLWISWLNEMIIMLQNCSFIHVYILMCCFTILMEQGIDSNVLVPSSLMYMFVLWVDKMFKDCSRPLSKM